MRKLAVLGPKGTYCDIAKDKYLKNIKEEFEIEYKPTIIKTAQASSRDTIAIVPFENMLDGFVLEALDTICATNSLIVKQLSLPVDFAFVSMANDIKDVKECFVQFKAAGQCLKFINRYDFRVTKTDSNGLTLEKYLENLKDPQVGAIIPIHLLDNLEYNIIYKRIADVKGNRTRFVVLKGEREKDLRDLNLDSYINHLIGKRKKFSASFMITSEEDKPGILFQILNSFHELNINMKSIMSRPLKTHMGEYKFYIEASFDLDAKNKIIDLLKRLNKNFSTDLLGIYNTK